MDSNLATVNLLSPDTETPTITPVPTPVSGSEHTVAIVTPEPAEKKKSTMSESCWGIMLQVS